MYAKRDKNFREVLLGFDGTKTQPLRVDINGALILTDSGATPPAVTSSYVKRDENHEVALPVFDGSKVVPARSDTNGNLIVKVI